MIRFFAGHQTAANLIMMAFLIGGILAWPSLQRATFPRLEPRRVEVAVPYPGARAEDIREAICQRIEDAMDTVNDVNEVACEAKEGLARAVVEMEEGASLDRFTAEIKTEIDAITDFPDNAESPIVKQLGLTDFVAAVAVSLPEPSTVPDLKAYAEAVKTRMLQWPDITKVTVKGFSDRQIRIELDDRVLRQFGLSAGDIAQKIARQSLDLPAGNLFTTEREVLIRYADERRKVNDFLDLVVVAGSGGGQIRLGDIAHVTERFELDEEKILFDGRRAALLEVSKAAREDTLTAIDAVNAFLEVERATAPPGVKLSVTRDGSSIVRDRLQLLVSNGVQGLLLVFLVMWLVFGLRYSFWVAMGLPVSFAGAFVAMVVIGYSINMLTMVGLLIAIGLLMDDAIVIAENIASHRLRGKTPLDAAVDGAREVLPSVAASFFTTTFIFGSLAFIKGDIGQMLRVVPVVMLIVLTVSLVEAFLVLPNHLNHALSKAQMGQGRVQGWVDDRISWLRERLVGPAVDACIRWRYLTLGAALAALILVLSLPAGGYLKFVAFPELDSDTIEARILLPQGTPLPRTEAVVDKVAAALRRIDEDLSPAQPDGQQLVRSITLRFNNNPDAFENGGHVATVTADLLSAELRTLSAAQLLERWRRETGSHADVLNLKFAETALGPGGLPIDIRLKGQDLDRLKQASLELQTWLTGYRGVNDLTDDLRPGKPEVRVRLKDGAATLGIDGRTVAEQLRNAFFGTTVNEIQIGPDVVEIDVRLNRANKSGVADLEDFAVVSSDGARVPITAVADLILDRGYARINRIDGLATVTIQGDVDTATANANAIVNDTLRRFMPDLLKRYPGVSLALEGQNKEAEITQQSMLGGFAVGVIGVFLLLCFLLRSYVEPIVVLLAIPLALVGMILGHAAMGLDISMPSMLGFVSLAGVVVNNSILLVNFTKLRHEAGETIHEAAAQASRARFRAIFLTSLTTLVGLLPILSETSLQAQILIPLVTSLVFGLMSSTVMVLLVVPALYTILDDLGLTTLARDRDTPDLAVPSNGEPA